MFRIGSASFRFSLLLACWYHSIKCLNYPFNASMEKHVLGFVLFCHVWLVLGIVHFIHGILPTLQNTLSEALRLPIAGDFSLPHSSVPPSQVPPSLEWRHYSNCSRRSLGLWVWSNFVWCSIFLFYLQHFVTDKV